jgi:hypothetical protein
MRVRLETKRRFHVLIPNSSRSKRRRIHTLNVVIAASVAITEWTAS